METENKGAWKLARHAMWQVLENEDTSWFPVFTLVVSSEVTQID